MTRWSNTLYSTGTLSWSYWNLEMLLFEERGKPEYMKKNLSEQGRERTTDSTHIWRQVQESRRRGEFSHHCAIPAIYTWHICMKLYVVRFNLSWLHTTFRAALARNLLVASAVWVVQSAVEDVMAVLHLTPFAHALVACSYLFVVRHLQHFHTFSVFVVSSTYFAGWRGGLR